MIRLNLRFVFGSGLLALIFCLALCSISLAQGTTPQAKKINNMEVQYFYAHGVLGLGFDVYKSPDIEAIVTEELDIHSLGFPFHYGVCAGFRNIAQIEYRKYTTKAHNIGSGGFTIEGTVTTSVPMKLKATDILFKVNPFVWTWMKPRDGVPDRCLFLIIGNGDATYRDMAGDGFDGSGPIYGAEVAAISKYVSFAFGATNQNIKYTTTRLFGIDIPYEVKASRFMMYVTMGLGFGI